MQKREELVRRVVLSSRVPASPLPRGILLYISDLTLLCCITGLFPLSRSLYLSIFCSLPISFPSFSCIFFSSLAITSAILPFCTHFVHPSLLSPTRHYRRLKSRALSPDRTRRTSRPCQSRASSSAWLHRCTKKSISSTAASILSRAVLKACLLIARAWSPGALPERLYPHQTALSRLHAAMPCGTRQSKSRKPSVSCYRHCCAMSSQRSALCSR